MEDQEIFNSTQTRTSTRTSTPATRDNKKKNQLSSKRPYLDWSRHENEIRR